MIYCNTKVFKGSWEDIQGLVQQSWSRLTDEDLLKIKNDPLKIYPFLRDYYGYSKEQAEKAVELFNLRLTGEAFQL